MGVYAQLVGDFKMGHAVYHRHAEHLAVALRQAVDGTEYFLLAQRRLLLVCLLGYFIQRYGWQFVAAAQVAQGQPAGNLAQLGFEAAAVLQLVQFAEGHNKRIVGKLLGEREVADDAVAGFYGLCAAQPIESGLCP